MWESLLETFGEALLEMFCFAMTKLSAYLWQQICALFP